MTPQPQQESSEPNWMVIEDGSDRDWRLISMYELLKIEHAINETEPGHLKEMHDSGNETIDKIRSRPAPSPSITPEPKCFGNYKEAQSDDGGCCHCNEWGYCADVTKAAEEKAAQARKATLDAVIEFTKGNSETIEADDGTLEDAVFLGELLAKIESLRGES